jgi:hypothetical protein
MFSYIHIPVNQMRSANTVSNGSVYIFFKKKKKSRKNIYMNPVKLMMGIKRR